MTKEEIGRCFGETTLTTVEFISKQIPEVGEYVCLEYNNMQILGMIETSLRGNVALQNDIYDPKTIERIIKIGDNDFYLRGTIKILGEIEHLKIPKIPAPPGTPVYKANKEILEKIFEKEGTIQIGSVLSQNEVKARININKMVSRHLAILAMTGAGKSNATSVIIDRLLEVNGSIIIFDMHGEYINTEFNNGSKNEIRPRINPLYLSVGEFKTLANIPNNAYVQERYFRNAYKKAKERFEETENTTGDFISEIIKEIEIEGDKAQDEENDTVPKRDYEASIVPVQNKLEDMENKYGGLFDRGDTKDIVNQIQSGSLNIVDLSSVDEQVSDIVVKHTLSNILNRRKNSIRNNIKKETLDFPIFSIIEEAHILVSEKRDTQSKYIIGKIAREGRKFGVGLCLVSQSPKALDSDSLSQINNMIVLRLVEQQDQRHVQSSSESLSEDLVKQLPSLNTGEAIILGPMTKIPLMVQIDKFNGITGGSDINIAKQWNDYKIEQEEKIKEAEEELF